MVVFLNEEEIVVFYVIGDGCKILETTTCIRTATLLLMSAYYVSDLDYPVIYGQFLGILQHWVVGDIFTQIKTTSWINFSEQFRLTYVKNKIKLSLHLVYLSLFFFPTEQTFKRKTMRISFGKMGVQFLTLNLELTR